VSPENVPNPRSSSAPIPERRVAARRRDATESVDRLLDGAQATFIERGYHAASVHDICSRANVGIGTFYAHFDHKRELLQKLVVDRAPLLSRLLTADDLLDRARLVKQLRRALDEPVSAGMWRAWHEAVAEEADLARFHSEWFAESHGELTAIVVEARKRSKRKGRRVSAPVAAWITMTLARELGIGERSRAPAIAELAQVIQEFVLGVLDVD
jgi:AcrR family transcriptional regulator